MSLIIVMSNYRRVVRSIKRTGKQFKRPLLRSVERVCDRLNRRLILCRKVFDDAPDKYYGILFVRCKVLGQKNKTIRYYIMKFFILYYRLQSYSSYANYFLKVEYTRHVMNRFLWNDDRLLRFSEIARSLFS